VPPRCPPLPLPLPRRPDPRTGPDSGTSPADGAFLTGAIPPVSATLETAGLCSPSCCRTLTEAGSGRCKIMGSFAFGDPDERAVSSEPAARTATGPGSSFSRAAIPSAGFFSTLCLSLFFSLSLPRSRRVLRSPPDTDGSTMATPAPLKAASNCRVGAVITGRAFRGVGGGRATDVAVAEDAVVLELLGVGAGGSEVLAARAACWRA